jgi:hypothetical protein
MKRSLLIVLFISSLIFRSFSQTQERQIVFSANGGLSLIGNLISSAIGQASNINHTKLPAYQINADYGITNVVSIGGAFSYQTFGAEFRNITYTNINGTTKTAPILNLNVNRSNIAARILFHYNTKSEEFDIYSGIRMGYTFWSVSHNLSDVVNLLGWVKGSMFAPQLVLFGFRGYLVENFGLNFELAIGAPHYASMGLVYKI